MTMIGLPNILSRIVVKGRKLSESEFLSIKKFDGKRVDVNVEIFNVINSTAEIDIITQTASSGKDMYLASASFENAVTVLGPFDVIIRLVVNGVTLETIERNQAAENVDFQFTFETKGIFVLDGQIIKITVQHNVSGGTATSATSAKLILWEETTGASPQIPSI